MARLPSELVAFLKEGLSIHVGSRDAAGAPVLARAAGVHVEDGGRALRLLVPARPGAALIEAVRHSREVAAVFCRPLTHHAVQIKGHDALLADAQPDDLTQRADSLRGLAAEIAPFGFAADFAAGLCGGADAALAVLRFTPAGAWEQTPGPGAGRAIGLLP